jgi:mRNA interferase HicA
MTSKQLIQLLEQNGWVTDRTQGSHYIMKKGGKTEVVPFHRKDVPIGTLNKILKRTGLK